MNASVTPTENVDPALDQSVPGAEQTDELSKGDLGDVTGGVLPIFIVPFVEPV